MEWKVTCPECGSHDVAFCGTERPGFYEAYARCRACRWRSPEVYMQNHCEAFMHLENLLTPPDNASINKPRTIIDKLRSMTDEELAEMWAANPGNPICEGCEEVNGYCDTHTDIGEIDTARCKERVLKYFHTPLTEEQEEKKMPVNLKPCPFCGGPAEMQAGGIGGAFVRCPTCDVRVYSGLNDGKPDCLAKWNTRAKEMTLNEYQRLAQRTSNEEHDDFKTVALKKIDNGILGLCGETGECADLWKKARHQGHKLDMDKLADECGDVLWYVAELAAGLGLSLEAVARHNVEKLEKRYPKGHFEAERSINREE